MSRTTPHFTEDQFLSAVVDTRDLGPEARHHLAACPACAAAHAGIERELANLTALAHAHTPRPGRQPVVTPAPKVKMPWLKPVAATATCGVIMALWLVIWPPAVRIPLPNGLPLSIEAEMESDRKLIQEIEQLEAYALSGLHAGLFRAPDTFAVDDFINFIAPL